jgi:hypothetical protein
MSVNLSGPIAPSLAAASQDEWVAEIIKRFSGAGRHKHEVCRFRQVQCNLPNRVLFNNAPSDINDLQVEAAVVSIMRNHLHIMTTCLDHLGHLRTDEWRSELRDRKGHPYTYQNLYNSAKQGLAPMSFGGLFDETNRFEYLYQGGQTSCYARVAAFYSNVIYADRKGNKLITLTELESELASYYDALLAANMDRMQWSIPSIKPKNPSATPARVVPDPWDTRAQRANTRDVRATNRAAEWMRQQKPLSPGHDFSDSAASGASTNRSQDWETDLLSPLARTVSYGTPAVEQIRDEVPSNSSLSAFFLQSPTAAQTVFPDQTTGFPLATDTAAAQPVSADDDAQAGIKRNRGEGKQTKSRKGGKKNKPKTKRRAANKKNKKAQQHAGRVSRHNKVFRRKTRKSK